MSYNVSVVPQCSEPYLGPSLAQSCSGGQFLVFMSLLDTFIRSKSNVAQLCERIHPIDPAGYEYDFIVVGGGTAGAVVARRLSDNPKWRVLLLEAGPDEPPGAQVPSMVGMFLGSDLNWRYKTTNEAFACLSTNGSCSWPRGKNLGGTSVHHGMMYNRGHPKDYDNWASMGNVGWTWQDVLPFFKLSENNAEIDRVGRAHHGTGGPLNVERFSWQPRIVDDILRAAEELGFGISDDLNGENITGFSISQMTTKKGVRVSSASAFLRPVRNRRNLDIALNATATRIIIEDLKAVGVEYVQYGERKIARSSHEVVVSGGAVDSPKLLLLSGIGPRSHLESVNVTVVKDLPGVGENLHNHVSFSEPYTINEPNKYDMNWAAALEYVAYQKGPMASTGLSQLTGILASNGTTPDHPNLQFFFNGYKAGCATTGEVGALKDNGRRAISVSSVNLQPHSRGHIRLASNDPMAKPIIWGNYLNDSRDASLLITGIRYAGDLMNAKSLGKYKIERGSVDSEGCSDPAGTTSWYDCVIRRKTVPENHQAGSCKMGPANDTMAVVDPRLNVHGIRGLRVADTSIMPQVISGNTAAPAMMIGERAAHFIKQDWQNVDPPHWHRKPRKFGIHQRLFF